MNSWEFNLFYYNNFNVKLLPAKINRAIHSSTIFVLKERIKIYKSSKIHNFFLTIQSNESVFANNFLLP